MPIYRGRFIIVDTRLTLNTTYFVAYLGQDLDGETYINP
jgi:UDP-N-acetylmuramyl pentapeptide synthase